MKIKMLSQEKRQLLAMVESQMKVAIEEPGLRFYELKAERDKLRKELSTEDLPSGGGLLGASVRKMIIEHRLSKD